MDLSDRMCVLSKAAHRDISRDDRPRPGLPDRLCGEVFHATRRDGRPVALLKVLQTNMCERDCTYCAFRSARDTRRTAMSPEDLARTFDAMHRAGLVRGLFLSSGVYGEPDTAMRRMVDTATLLRERYDFRGYIHLKILPGASNAAIASTLSLADRVSVNLEAPSAQRLTALCPSKDYDDELRRPLATASRLRADYGRMVSLTTQMVVGAAAEGDDEILATAAGLYRNLRLARVYYSAFSPIRGTPLEDHPPTPAWRQFRLYQADRLVAKYGFSPEELVYDERGHLQKDVDPKLAWAQQHPERFPVELNRAAKESLLRVPGIGPISAQRILRWRKESTLSDLVQIRKAGANAEKAAPYVLLNGRRPLAQLSLW